MDIEAKMRKTNENLRHVGLGQQIFENASDYPRFILSIYRRANGIVDITIGRNELFFFATLDNLTLHSYNSEADEHYWLIDDPSKVRSTQ